MCLWDEDGGVVDSKEVVLGGESVSYSLAAAACIHGKQIWFFSDFSHWGSQSFSLPSSNRPPPHTSLLSPPSILNPSDKRINKIRCSDMPYSFFLHVSLGLCHTNVALTCHTTCPSSILSEQESLLC